MLLVIRLAAWSTLIKSGRMMRMWSWSFWRYASVYVQLKPWQKANDLSDTVFYSLHGLALHFEIEKSGLVHVLLTNNVLQGNGRTFCAGGDLRMFYNLGKSSKCCQTEYQPLECVGSQLLSRSFVMILSLVRQFSTSCVLPRLFFTYSLAREMLHCCTRPADKFILPQTKDGLK